VNTTNISYTRNHLSELLSLVKEGESILIMDRNQPVARLEPVDGHAGGRAGANADLVRRGLVRAGRNPLNVKAFAALPLPRTKNGGDVLSALLSDREEGR
jgi:antitoxin (DNA-binding transcriptional repressor) of toxin-antitoxin stability system